MEAQEYQNTEPYPEESKDLQWATRPTQKTPTRDLRLARPVLIPTTVPSIQASFLRAWPPDLEQFDVQREEFLQFVDHLNVCKAASPPLQVLNLAGTIAGFMPSWIAQVAGAASQAAAAGGTYAVAKVRIARYLARANEEYFTPRGLVVTIAKENNIGEHVHQTPAAPLLAPLQDNRSEAPAKIHERRLMTLEGQIAPLQIQTGGVSQEQNWLDKMSAKGVERKSQKQERKAVEESEKWRDDDGPKERKKLEKERRKIVEEMSSVNRKAASELRKKPDEAGKIERERLKEMRKLDSDLEQAQKDYDNKHKESSGEEGKSASKFLWIVVKNYDPARKEPNTL